jgi:hypothetical protein
MTNACRDHRAGRCRQLAQCDALRNACRCWYWNNDFEPGLVVGQRIDERASGFARNQSSMRQRLARGLSLSAKFLDEVIAVRHERTDRNRRVRTRALDDFRRFSSGRPAQLHERCVIRAFLARISLVDLLRELRKDVLRAAAVLSSDHVRDIGEGEIHLA